MMIVKTECSETYSLDKGVCVLGDSGRPWVQFQNDLTAQ